LSLYEQQAWDLDPGLTKLGWDGDWAALFDQHVTDGGVPARVSHQHRGAYTVHTSRGELRAELPGRLLHASNGPDDLPAVGDWVAARLDNAGPAIITSVLPRKSKFTRKAAWQVTQEQVLAANVDIVFLVSGLDRDFNPRRIERYLTMAWGSGATPVVVLNKADLCDDVAERMRLVESVAAGVPIHAVSGTTGEGIDELRPHLKENRTGTLLGSSGVGKSTIVNALCGQERLRTAEIRYDGRGRHTTTHRELVFLPGGGLIIDTPGMRELQLWDPGTGLDDAFDDIDSLAAECRFRDCEHDHEPGCAVRAAIEVGDLDRARLASYHKLKRELRHLELRRDARARAEERRKWGAIHRAQRANTKAKYGRGRR
jgi:ribosome biogenesis GTPase